MNRGNVCQAFPRVSEFHGSVKLSTSSSVLRRNSALCLFVAGLCCGLRKCQANMLLLKRLSLMVFTEI